MGFLTDHLNSVQRRMKRDLRCHLNLVQRSMTHPSHGLSHKSSQLNAEENDLENVPWSTIINTTHLLKSPTLSIPHLYHSSSLHLSPSLPPCFSHSLSPSLPLSTFSSHLSLSLPSSLNPSIFYPLSPSHHLSVPLSYPHFLSTYRSLNSLILFLYLSL